MTRLGAQLSFIIASLWTGGLWSIGYLAVPTLFHAQPDRQLAGELAGHLFETLGYIGLLCGSYLLLLRWRALQEAVLHDALFRVVMLMLLIDIGQLFVIQPEMATLKSQALPLDVMHSTEASRFGLWHAVSSILYLLQSLAGLVLLILQFRDKVKIEERKNGLPQK